MNNDVREGSQVFLHMPGDYVLSGVLEHYGRHREYNSEIQYFHVQTHNESFTANLQPFPIQRGRNSNRVIDYRCFIPISGYRVLSTFLEPHCRTEFSAGSARVAIRLPELDYAFFCGVLHVGEGEGPEWIPRHM